VFANIAAQSLDALLKSAKPVSIAQHCKPAYRISQGGAYENARSVVCRQAQPRRSDRHGAAIGQNRNPAMMTSVSPGNYGSDGERRDRVSRGKTVVSRREALPPSAKVSAKLPFGGSELGRQQETAGLKTSVTISASVTPSPASSAVLVIFESFRRRPIPYSASGAATMAAEVAAPGTARLNAVKAIVPRK
jgi:hypothetical protein